jgi:hypothetical protein
VTNLVFEVTAKVSGLPADGVIASQGGSALGWSLFIREGKIHFATRNQKTINVVSAPLPDKASQEFHAKVMKGKLLLRSDKRRIAAVECSPFLNGHPNDGVAIGHDMGGTVADYGDAFTGKIESVQVELK